VYDFLFAIIELFSLAVTVEALQGKTCFTMLNDRCYQEGVGQFEPRFQGKGSSVFTEFYVCGCRLVKQISNKLEPLGQCIPLPGHVLPVPPSGESVRTADLCPLTTFCVSQ